MSSFFRDTRVLVTGATGSIGSEVVRQLLRQNPAVIRVFSRDEHKQFLLQEELRAYSNIRYLLGDVRDKQRLSRALEDIDMVFHCAAYKHVPLCEYNSFEAVKTNVMGTQNVIEAALERGVRRVLLVSTDKAASPGNVMGATKLLAEKLMSAAMNFAGPRTVAFGSVRFGNVIGSRGSVLPVFCRQIRDGGPLTVTHPDMTRFFMSIPQAVALMFSAMERMKGGEVFVLKMPAVRLADLVDVLIEEVAPRYGTDPSSIERKVIGVRPGEKMDELLLTQEEAECAEETDTMFVVPSALAVRSTRRPNAQPYSSGTVSVLPKEQIRSIVREFVEEYFASCT